MLGGSKRTVKLSYVNEWLYGGKDGRGVVNVLLSYPTGMQTSGYTGGSDENNEQVRRATSGGDLIK